MFKSEQAKTLVKKNYPKHIISKTVDYKEWYVFFILDPTDDIEGDMDPYVSVHKTSGKVEDFSIFTDVDPADIDLFLD